MERLHILSCCVCVFSCVFMIFGCAYITVLVYELRDLRILCKTARDVVSDSQQETVATIEMQSESDVKENEDFQTFKYRLKRAMPNLVEEVKTRHKRQPKSKKSKKPKVKAGHYVTKVTTDYVKKHVNGYEDSDPFSITEPCTYVTELKGTLCRSRDFFVNNTEGTIQVFKPASWTNRKLAPFNLKDNGEFQAKSKGIYFVYAQILFFDHYDMQSVVLNHKEIKKGKEEHVLSCTTNGGGSNQRPLYNTCSMQGLVYMNKKDILTVVNLNQDIKLHFGEATTYFGAFLLK